MDIRLYKNNTSPLEEVFIDDLKTGDLIVTSQGTRLKVKEPGIYEMDKASELELGVNIEDLSPKLLKTFWSMMDYFTKHTINER